MTITWDWELENPNVKREVSEQVYDALREGAKAASYQVFGGEDYRGMSTDDIASEVSIKYFQTQIIARSAKALGRIAGRRLAISVATRTPKAVEFSTLANDGPTDLYFVGHQESTEASMFLNEIIDAICGDENSVDRQIVEMRKEQMTYREIADLLGMKSSAVRARFYTFRDKAHAMFGKEVVDI